jgi:hypothetical protein
VDSEGLRYWDIGYGDLEGVAWGGTSDSNGVPEIEFRLTTPGKSITLNSFDYGGYQANWASSVRVYDLDYNLLFEDDDVIFPFDGHGTQLLGITSFTGLRLQWGPSGYNAGIDNLSFDVVDAVAPGVPEPATWAMMIAGFGLIGAAMRRKGSYRVSSVMPA